MTAWLVGELAALAVVAAIFGAPFVICAALWIAAQRETIRRRRSPKQTVDIRVIHIDNRR